jgi:hypothetical protein
MNQHFNLTRFTRLLRKHTAEYLMNYALGAAVLLGGMLVVLGFLAYMQGGIGGSAQAVLFTLFLLGAGSFFTSTVLAQFGVGSRAALALTLPTSQLEKFLVAWVFSLPVFLVVFVAEFYLADWLVLSVFREKEALINIFVRSETTYAVLTIFLILHGVALWGSIAFKGLQFIKTAFLFFALALGVGILNFQWLRAMFGSTVQMALPLGTVHMHNSPALSLTESQEHLILLPLLLLIPLLWVASYARLTEKQL